MGRMVARELFNISSPLSGNCTFIPDKDAESNCNVKFLCFQLKTCLPIYLAWQFQYSPAYADGVLGSVAIYLWWIQGQGSSSSLVVYLADSILWIALLIWWSMKKGLWEWIEVEICRLFTQPCWITYMSEKGCRDQGVQIKGCTGLYRSIEDQFRWPDLHFAQG